MTNYSGSIGVGNNNESGIANSGVDFGSLLVSGRKFKSYTVEQISEQLKIPVRTIVALEGNDVAALPAPTFTQGYIRAYAKYLEVSVDDVLAIYNRAVPHEQVADLKPRSHLPEEANSQSLVMKTVTVLLILAGIMAIIYGSFQYYQEKADVMETALESKQRSFTGNSLDSPGTARLAIKQNARLTDNGELVVLPPQNNNLTDTAADVDMDMSAEDSLKEEDLLLASIITQESGVGSLDVLKIFAEKGSWVQVRDASSARLFYNMVAEGGVKTLRGQAPFSITLGNAKTTRVIINGLDIDVSEHIRANNTAIFSVSTDQQQVVFH